MPVAKAQLEQHYEKYIQERENVAVEKAKLVQQYEKYIQELVDLQTKEIDEWLTKNFGFNDSLHFYGDYLHIPEVSRELIALYTNKGWEVTIHYDEDNHHQRYLEFK